MEGGSDLSQVLNGTHPFLGCVMLLGKESLSPSHTHASEHLGWDVLFQSSPRCVVDMLREILPQVKGKMNVSHKQSTASTFG